MNTNTQQLRAIGQSVWLDNITRDLLDSGTLADYIGKFGVTGLTSNPTIFAEAIGGSRAYDAGIRALERAGNSDEAIFTELALEDLRRAADLFRPTFDATAGMDGWASMEVSPLLADDTAGTIEAATRLFRQAARPNIFIKIPGTPAGIPAIEESIFNGVPINVTLLFSSAQYLAAAHAYLRGIERRLSKGLQAPVASVASVFVSRWDKIVATRVPAPLQNRLGIAVALETYRVYRELLESPRWRALASRGAQPQRLLWASTGTKDPKASDTLYVEALAAPDTVNTLPEKTLRAFADHGQVKKPMPVDGGDGAATLREFTAAGVDPDALALQLQLEGARSFTTSWSELMQQVASKRRDAA